MDTTSKYIKMCEKAEEIQNCWKAEEGDFVAIWGYSWLNNPRIECCSYDKFEACGKGLHVDEFSLRKQRKEFGDREIGSYKVVWLPRQDQLQKIAFPLCVEQGICGMPSWSWACIQCLCEFMQKHRELIGGDRVHLPDNSITLEQWWLMLVMEKKYDKHWDNKKEEWVK